MKKILLTVVMPAYNEENNIKSSIKAIYENISRMTPDFELLVINDGSTDNTGQIIDVLSRKYKKIRIIHHCMNMGFGYTIKEGIRLAKGEYFTQFHGDNDTSAKSIAGMINQVDSLGFVSSYTVNTDSRNLQRRVISKSFIILMNFVFGLHLKYFNGCFISKTENLRNLKLICPGLAIYSEIKIRLIKRGATYKEVPFVHIKRKSGKSKAVSVKSINDTLYTFFCLIRDVYLYRRP
jgi:dolichol-phosphate mannosyltransferase